MFVQKCMCVSIVQGVRVLCCRDCSQFVWQQSFSVQEEDSNNVHVFGSGNVGYSGSTFSCVAWLGGQSVCVCLCVFFKFEGLIPYCCIGPSTSAWDISPVEMCTTQSPMP